MTPPSLPPHHILARTDALAEAAILLPEDAWSAATVDPDLLRSAWELRRSLTDDEEAFAWLLARHSWAIQPLPLLQMLSPHDGEAALLRLAAATLEAAAQQHPPIPLLVQEAIAAVRQPLPPQTQRDLCARLLAESERLEQVCEESRAADHARAQVRARRAGRLLIGMATLGGAVVGGVVGGAVGAALSSGSVALWHLIPSSRADPDVTPATWALYEALSLVRAAGSLSEAEAESALMFLGIYLIPSAEPDAPFAARFHAEARRLAGLPGG